MAGVPWIFEGAGRHDVLARFSKSSGFAPEELQAELVTVVSDLTDQVHQHNRSTAYVIALDHTHGFKDPRGAEIYWGGQWTPYGTGTGPIIIPSCVPHGFRVTGHRGYLCFLSVQTPPIFSGEGHDDYELVKP